MTRIQVEGDKGKSFTDVCGMHGEQVFNFHTVLASASGKQGLRVYECTKCKELRISSGTPSHPDESRTSRFTK